MDKYTAVEEKAEAYGNVAADKAGPLFRGLCSTFRVSAECFNSLIDDGWDHPDQLKSMPANYRSHFLALAPNGGQKWNLECLLDRVEAGLLDGPAPKRLRVPQQADKELDVPAGRKDAAFIVPIEECPGSSTGAHAPGTVVANKSSSPQIKMASSEPAQVSALEKITLGNKIRKEPRWKRYLKFSTGIGIAWDIDASLPGDKMAVADCLDRRVLIYDTKGRLKKTIKVPENLSAVAVFQNQLVVVDDTKSVKMYNQNGRKMFEFYTVPQSGVDKTAVDLCGVAVMRDTILVGDVQRSVITKHRSSDGSLIDTVSVKTRPCFLAIDSKDRIVISGWNQHQVDIVNDNGDTLITIKPTINGKHVGSCRGVCCDSSAIYIAVWNGEANSGHIHQYDPKGRFLSCLAKGLQRPRGISLTSDGQQLALADYKSVKIYNKV